MRFSTAGFFHQTIPPGPLIQGGERLFASNSQSYLTKSVPQRCQWHSWCRLSSAIDTTVAALAVPTTPLMPWPKFAELTPRCHWHRCSRHIGVNDIDGAASTVSLTPLMPPQRCQLHRSGQHCGFSYQTWFKIISPQRRQWHRWCCRSAISKSNIFANSKTYAKRL
jgi:hypothetical protein